MPLIANIGRRSLRTRVLITTLYGILFLGAITMVYPFLLMIAGSSKSGVDSYESKILPSFLYNDDVLFKKYTEGFFNESLNTVRLCLQTNIISFKAIKKPDAINQAFIAEWDHFLTSRSFDEQLTQASFIYAPVSRSTIPNNLRRFKKKLIALSDGNIHTCNTMLGSDFVSWNNVFVLPRLYLSKNTASTKSLLSEQLAIFKKELSPSACYYLSLEGYYRFVYLRARYSSGIESYNRIHKTNYTSFNEVPLSRTYPQNARRSIQEEWLLFVRNIINPLWVQADLGAQKNYQRYLKAAYTDINVLNERYQTKYTSFDSIPLFDQESKPSILAISDWGNFITGWGVSNRKHKHILSEQHIVLSGIDFDFRAFLQSKYTTCKQLNDRLGTSYSSWEAISPPQLEALYASFSKSIGRWRVEFIIRNFLSVIDYLLIHGDALLNTIIYCGLAILLALIVNPLAAYALSRYELPSRYLALLFLMLTMAFPPMVTQIPAFLMLRELRLLNTFWALVLPGMANGLSIFLLKGFFDSLPRDLYDSAALDGAGEFRIFWHITMSLSKPILAVIALNAFTLAYGNFMMALLICQDQNMWTLMPWLYQLQQRSAPGVIFSSLLIAATPTFLIFMFCQNMIMRGIIIPVEK